MSGSVTGASQAGLTAEAEAGGEHKYLLPPELTGGNSESLLDLRVSKSFMLQQGCEWSYMALFQHLQFSIPKRFAMASYLHNQAKTH